MEHIKDLLDILLKAVENGRNVKITADEVKIEAGDLSVSALEITVE